MLRLLRLLHGRPLAQCQRRDMSSEVPRQRRHVGRKQQHTCHAPLLVVRQVPFSPATTPRFGYQLALCILTIRQSATRCRRGRLKNCRPL